MKKIGNGTIEDTTLFGDQHQDLNEFPEEMEGVSTIEEYDGGIAEMLEERG